MDNKALQIIEIGIFPPLTKQAAQLRGDNRQGIDRSALLAMALRAQSLVPADAAIAVADVCVEVAHG